ncbi:hypothetical protein niasHT_039432 [Heterodera trifolii]|uniref:Transthyretin-like family protein n=1 Tax=Heterodera trifolii TaxID=157864 RepID=A0ABD2J841_9BILA
MPHNFHLLILLFLCIGIFCATIVPVLCSPSPPKKENISIWKRFRKFAANFSAGLAKFVVPLIINNRSNKTQSAGVYGALTCNGSPAGGVRVKLFDVDRWFESDDLLADGWTAQNGTFALYGSTKEATKIVPKLNIYHDCNDTKICQRKFSIFVPLHFVNEGKIPSQFYHLGTIELSEKFPHEQRDCLH